MPGKNKYWHKNWTRLPNGRLRHSTGIEFERGDCGHILECQDQTHEFSPKKGADKTEISRYLRKVARLRSEAYMFNKKNPFL